ncbi:protein of unassigned function [Methylobacterium oryzae CBMB20]|uniref:Protein of unassigned function n=1 Tax=Methylobacterium oryzae CBMB20 TaxID=693986 RepID=A0A089NV68_9HYPH|nr:protein of unassigned function [Methylobacterium oryzae CBMB20]
MGEEESGSVAALSHGAARADTPVSAWAPDMGAEVAVRRTSGGLAFPGPVRQAERPYSATAAGRGAVHIT